MKNNKEECYHIIFRAARLYLAIEAGQTEISVQSLFDSSSTMVESLEEFEK